MIAEVLQAPFSQKPHGLLLAARPYNRLADGGLWRRGGELVVARSSHAATLVGHEKVLLCGGHTADGAAVSGCTNSAELYDWAAETSEPTGAMGAGYAAHPAVVLANGRVLVPAVDTSELYMPATGTWSPTGGMRSARVDYTATVLADGRVLVAGGLEECSGVPMVSAEIYSPDTHSWTSTGPMRSGRLGHTAVLLGDGTVLVAGGVTLVGCEIETASGAEIYDPVAGVWHQAGVMSYPRFSHTATVLVDGRVLIAGGCELCHSVDECPPIELYNPRSGSWTSGPPLLSARAEHTATLLLDGRVLVAGGRTSHSDATASVEIYDPLTSAWSPAPSLQVARRYHSATRLPTGGVLVTGGQSVADDPTVSYVGAVEIYEPSE